ncbi:MAG: gamma-glutamylcyclotransferase [Kaiparowitsia implicata GSE-PSE-MK54-09C]|jgi:gamma-glutamylcyclotransferase (GGCT)/AIG2-like uncharacterized protein YtfP|nr:gamma-glutamylcyclotransferase [Kaiparowitsia implicata GSE-PSE-MK54-09C]
MEPLRVFVYGTLKPGGLYYSDYCKAHVVAYWRAIAPGILFHLPAGYPALCWDESGWDESEANTVHGYVLEFANPSVLVYLDELEGYSPNRPPEQNEYDRQRLPLRMLDGAPAGTAWGYTMTFTQIQQLGGQRVESGDWSSTLIHTMDSTPSHISVNITPID